jgi:hypothetical protein
MVQNTMFVAEIFRVNDTHDLQYSLRETGGALSWTMGIILFTFLILYCRLFSVCMTQGV